MKDALSIFASHFTPPRGKSGEEASFCIPSLTGSADAFLALTLAIQGADLRRKTKDRVVLAVTPGLPDADRLADDLKILTSNVHLHLSPPPRILEFPPLLDGDRSALGLRLKTIAALKAWSLNPHPCVIVAAFPALATPIPQTTEPLTLHCSTFTSSLSAFADKLARFGYERRPQVEKEGDYSIRGGIVDIWSPGEEFPVRAEFFGEDLESLRTFNPALQTSIERIERCEILPIKVKDKGEGEQRNFSLLDLLPKESAILSLEHNSYNLSSLHLHLSPPPFPIIYTGDPPPEKTPTYDFQTSPLPGFSELGADEAHHPELFDAARKRLDQHLASSAKRGAFILKLDELSGGFEIPGLIVVTKSDRVFAKHKTHYRTNAAIGQGPRLSDFDDLEPGEYVVHIDYGVGRYIGSSEIVVDGRRNEVFTIEYADGGKLHVPAAHAHLLSRYVGVKGEAVRLHRLDGKRWEKDKKDAQKAVTDLAAALLETQARRETVPGFAYDVQCEGRDRPGVGAARDAGAARDGAGLRLRRRLRRCRGVRRGLSL